MNKNPYEKYPRASGRTGFDRLLFCTYQDMVDRSCDARPAMAINPLDVSHWTGEAACIRHITHYLGRKT